MPLDFRVGFVFGKILKYSDTMSSFIEHIVLLRLEPDGPRVMRVFGEKILPLFIGEFCFPVSMLRRRTIREILSCTYPFVLTNETGEKLYCATFVQQQRWVENKNPNIPIPRFLVLPYPRSPHNPHFFNPHQLHRSAHRTGDSRHPVARALCVTSKCPLLLTLMTSVAALSAVYTGEEGKSDGKRPTEGHGSKPC